MPRQTIKTDYTSSDPLGPADMNNINLNLLYILDEGTVFNGIKHFYNTVRLGGSSTYIEITNNNIASSTGTIDVTGSTGSDIEEGILKVSTGNNRLAMGIVDGSYAFINAVESGVAVRSLHLNPQGGEVRLGATTGYTSISGTSITTSTGIVNVTGSTGSDFEEGIFKVSTGNNRLAMGIVDGSYAFINAVETGVGTRILSLNPQGGEVIVNGNSPSGYNFQVVGTCDITGAFSTGGTAQLGGSSNYIEITNNNIASATGIVNVTGSTGSDIEEGILKVSTGNNRLAMGIVDGSYAFINAVESGVGVRALHLNPQGGEVRLGATTGYTSISGTSITTSTGTLNIDGDISSTDGELNFSAKILPTTAPTQSSWSLTTTPTIIPRGIYNIVWVNVPDIVVEIFVSGVWRVMYVSEILGNFLDYGGFVASDGTNVRISVATGTQTVYYQKY